MPALAASATYNFSTCNPGTDCWAYENDVDQFPFGGAAGNRNDHTLPGNYAWINSSNDVRWTTDDPGANDEMLLWVEMTVTQAIA